ncbi:MAG: hypothetical protein ACXWO7_11050, partial [Candidatus Limnocylindrales bacterium]
MAHGFEGLRPHAEIQLGGWREVVGRGSSLIRLLAARGTRGQEAPAVVGVALATVDLERAARAL